MEDTLITFETAKLAKEKGWDGDFVESHKILTTQSLLAKWLREKHNIIIIVDYEGIDGYYYKFYSYKGMKKFYDASNTNYKTYEEALEIGLQEALKLI